MAASHRPRGTKVYSLEDGGLLYPMPSGHSPVFQAVWTSPSTAVVLGLKGPAQIRFATSKPTVEWAFQLVGDVRWKYIGVNSRREVWGMYRPRADRRLFATPVHSHLMKGVHTGPLALPENITDVVDFERLGQVPLAFSRNGDVWMPGLLDAVRLLDKANPAVETARYCAFYKHGEVRICAVTSSGERRAEISSFSLRGMPRIQHRKSRSPRRSRHAHSRPIRAELPDGTFTRVEL